ncbi:MAG TPA: ABC transporter substrate-binding protein [Actinomycetota bacterium]|nr:ABC transporter substrate-binding protein [Actinomycetota bacterium]
MRRPGWLRVIALLSVLTLVATGCRQQDEGGGGDAGGDQQLTLGLLYPQTGSLAFLGPPMRAGFDMAVQEINEAGGVLGSEIVTHVADEAGDASVAAEAGNQLLGRNVHAIVGAGASGMTRAVIENVTGSEVLMCSGSNTSAEFTEYEDNGYYIRTAPPDVLQGQVLAGVIAEDNRQRVAILFRSDGYGRGLAQSTAENLREAGVNVVHNEGYDVNATTFDADVSAAMAQNPDAVVVVSFAEGAQIIQALLERDLDANQIYGVDGNQSSTLPTTVNPNNANVLDGMKGTAPSADAVEGFGDRLRQFNTELKDTIFGPQKYDCVMLIALAAVAAGEISSEAIRDNIVDLTRGDNECAGFQECAELLRNDETISYQFASGTESFSDVGEPTNGLYDVWTFRGSEMTTLRQERVGSGSGGSSPGASPGARPTGSPAARQTGSPAASPTGSPAASPGQ